MVRPKKYLGQHFLNSEAIAGRIAQALTGDGYDFLIEVGPGKGMLTKHLLRRSFQLCAIEADIDMLDHLEKEFPVLKVIQGDFLRVDLFEITGNNTFAIVGNFPYNISSQILFKLLDYRSYALELVGMFQKEMAQRVIADPGSREYGVISVLVQAYYDGEYLFSVEPAKFNPPPKVRSGVIRLRRKIHQNLGCDADLFRKIVKATFNQRRKMLRNTLKPLVKDNAVLKDDFFDLRPEKLSVSDFVDLTNDLEKFMV